VRRPEDAERRSTVSRLRRAFATGGIGEALLEASGLRHKLFDLRGLAQEKSQLGTLALHGLPDLSLDWMMRFAHGAFLARGAESWTASLNGHRAHRYSFAGTGTRPPALLLHGLGGTASSMAVLVPPLLELCRRVVLLELPGHGRSPMPAQGPLAVREYAEVAMAALDELHAHEGPAVLIGNSLGGGIALGMAQERAPQVAGVVGLNPAGATIDFTRVPGAFGDPVEGAFAMADLLFHRAPLLFWLVARDYSRLWSSPLVQRIMRDGRTGLGEREVGPERLAAIRCPVLILWGEADRLLPASSVDYFRKHLGERAVELIPDCGHVPQLERPAYTRRRVKAFVEALPPR
jgi:pimeloyl-ACP methyl ester carboxylesterase